MVVQEYNKLIGFYAKVQYHFAFQFHLIDIEIDEFVEWERAKVSIRGARHITKSLCLPFFTILNALGNPVVDYFSLDIEGAELPVLHSIPWQKVKIRVRVNQILRI